MRRLSSISYFLSLGFSQSRRLSSSQFQINIIRFHSDDPSLLSSKSPGVLALYKNLVDQGKLQHHPYQEKVAFELENLLGRLKQYEKDMEEYHVNLEKWEKNRENEMRKLLTEEAEQKQQGGIWTSVDKQRKGLVEKLMFRKKPEVEAGVGQWVSYLNRERKLDSLVGRRPIAPPAPKGLYIYGNVGSGHDGKIKFLQQTYPAGL